ncbi:transcription initiation factor TFIID subunit 9B-like [Leptinotarsa decemlineata]|uniref:transcription initiation factor TFIID subunit 9B-like n=1 Tax=Leptinotarsa decemlineata TaxID=7539 RepID=UPI003D30BF08
MSEQDESKLTQPKRISKNGQVIMANMKEMGITDYEPNTVVQLNDFVYRYAASILEEARAYANNSKKKFPDVNDVRLALQHNCESTFATPPPREVPLELAQTTNESALPPVNPHCGLVLPPDRYHLSSCNYTFRSTQKNVGKSNFGISDGPGMRLTPESNISFSKRTVSEQTDSLPNSVTEIKTQHKKTALKPRIHMLQNVQLTPVNGSGSDSNSLKRKREDESENGV